MRIKIFFTTFVLLLAVLATLLTERTAKASEGPILITPPRISKDGESLVLAGQGNLLEFGICGLQDAAEDSMAVKLTGDDINGYLPSRLEVKGGYRQRRQGESVTCGPGDRLNAYGPKVGVQYTPRTPGRKDMRVSYTDASGRTVYLSRDFTLQAVDQWPADSFELGKRTLTPPNLGDLRKKLNFWDIFPGSIAASAKFQSTPAEVAAAILQILLTIAGILGLIAFFWNGFNLIVSQGDTARVEKAKKGLLAAVIGLLLIVFAYMIIASVNVFNESTESPTINYK